MGGAPQSVRFAALSAALWCAALPSCNGTDTSAPSLGAAAGTSGSSSSAGQGSEPARGPRSPVAAAGGEGGSDAEPHRSLGSGGEPGVDPKTNGGANDDGGAPPVTTVAPPRPSCGKQLSGASCGLNMSPPGDEAMRYFCSEGAVMAEARCPGTCDVETNSCVQSGGTGDGTDGAGIHTVLRCRACYASTCRAQLMACDADPLCVAHLDCYDTCQLDRDCYLICNDAFAEEPLFNELNACVETTGCAGKCPATTDGAP